MSYKPNRTVCAMLALVGEGIGHTVNFDFLSLSPDEWKMLRKESETQGVSLLAFSAIKGYETLMPLGVFEKWQQQAMSALLMNGRVAGVREKLVQLLENNNIDYIIFKGERSASYYPAPMFRTQGDIDVLVPPSQLEKARGVLCENGFTCEHGAFFSDGVCLEIGVRVPGIPSGSLGREIEEYMASPATVRLGGYVTFDDTYHAVCILLHMLHHMFSSGFGIRHLCDFACFIDKTRGEPFWQQALIPTLERFGLFRFACALGECCRSYLGVALPEGFSDVPGSVCEDLMRDILENGNFGRKNTERARSGNMLTSHEKAENPRGAFASMLGNLHYSVRRSRPVRRCILLYPFMFAWRVMRYLWLWLCGKRSSLSKLEYYASERREVYDRLKVFETEEN